MALSHWLDRARRRVSPTAFVVGIALLLTLRLALFIWRYSANVLFGDQWDFLSVFFDHDPGIAELFFGQHGPHREGIGLIADKVLYPLTAWNVRVEALMIGACVAVAMLLALLLKKRIFGTLDYWDALIPGIFLTLSQYETFTITPNPAYSGFPLLLLLLYLLALLLRNEWVKSCAVLILNFLSIYTGFGIFMGGVTVAFFTWLGYRRLRRFSATPAAIVVGGFSIACVSFASFFHNYVFEPAVDCFVFPFHPLSSYPSFVALMFSSVLGIHGPPFLAYLVGLPLAILVVYLLAVKLRQLMQAAVPIGNSLTVAILLGYSCLFAANTAVGRVCTGLPAGAQSSRYVTLMIPAFLGIYFCLRTISVPAIQRKALVVFALGIVPGHVYTPRRVVYYADRKSAWAACYRATENTDACDAKTAFKIYPDAERTRLQQKLDYLKKNRLNLFSE